MTSLPIQQRPLRAAAAALAASGAGAGTGRGDSGETLRRRCFALSKTAVAALPDRAGRTEASPAAVVGATPARTDFLRTRLDAVAVPRAVCSENDWLWDGSNRWCSRAADLGAASTAVRSKAWSVVLARAERQAGVHAWESNPSSWPRHSITRYSDQQREIFCSTPAMNNYFVDRSKGHCRLCDEPVANLSTHSGYWDHCNLLLFLRICASYARHWDAAAITSPTTNAFLRGVVATFGTAGRVEGTDAVLGDRSSAARRSAIHALLSELAQPPPPPTRGSHIQARHRGGLQLALQGKWGWAMGGMGERMFRADVGRIIVPLLPPMSAQMQTRFQQKCWGRKNLEMLYDTLRVGEIEARFGLPVRTEKNDKGSLMRQLVAELIIAEPSGAVRPAVGLADGVLPLLLGDAKRWGPPSVESAPDPVTNDVRSVLIATLLNDIAFELVVLMSAHYVGRASAVWERYGRPALHEMQLQGYAQCLEAEDDVDDSDAGCPVPSNVAR